MAQCSNLCPVIPTSLARMTDMVLGAFLGHAVLVVLAGHLLGAGEHASHLGVVIGTVAAVVVRTAVARSPGQGTHVSTGSSTALLATYVGAETFARQGDPVHVLLDPWLWLAPAAVALGRVVTLAIAAGLARLAPTGRPLELVRPALTRVVAIRRPKRPERIHHGTAGARAPPLLGLT